MREQAWQYNEQEEEATKKKKTNALTDSINFSQWIQYCAQIFVHM